MIHEKVGGDILEIQPLSFILMTIMQLTHKGESQLNNNFKDISEYGTIYLGSPIWFGTIAPPVASFLYGQSLAGKTIIPFYTYDGLDVGESNEEIVRL